MPPESGPIGIDVIVEQLRAVMEVKKGGLPEAVSAAPKLLRLPRYKPADDRQASLASDIEAAIARLPPAVAKDASNLLPIALPGSYLNDRWRAIGAGGFSSPAKKWRWTSVFGRVATELLALYADGAAPSYHVKSLHIHQVVFACDSEESHRLMRFDWNIESHVPDLEWFAFLYNAKNQMYPKWAPDDEPEATRIPVADDNDAHLYWYVMHLRQQLVINQPTKLPHILIWLKPSSGEVVQPWLEYALFTPVDKLILTADIITRDVRSDRFWCSERDTASGKVLDELEAEVGQVAIPSELHDFHNPDSERPILFYQPDSPKVGCTYRLAWKIDAVIPNEVDKMEQDGSLE